MSDPPLQGSLSRIGVICPNWVGDVVMATPVLRALRAHAPDASIVGLMQPGHDELLRGVPWLDQMIAMRWKGFTGTRRAAQALRSHRIQALLLLPNSFRSAVVARLSGATVRVGYRRDRRGWLLTHTLDVQRTDSPTPTIEYYNALGRFALGSAEIEARPELAVTDDERAAATEMLRGVESPLVLMCPGASKPAKRWPPERFAKVADGLAEAHEFTVAITGSPSERPILDAMIGAARHPVVDLAARGIRLGELKAVIQQAALLITNDTGPRHLAAALGTPAVTLFGPTDHRWTTLPHARERLLLAEPFLPEQLVADRHPRLCDIGRIEVGDVVTAASGLLERASAAN